MWTKDFSSFWTIAKPNYSVHSFRSALSTMFEFSFNLRFGISPKSCWTFFKLVRSDSLAFIKQFRSSAKPRERSLSRHALNNVKFRGLRVRDLFIFISKISITNMKMRHERGLPWPCALSYFKKLSKSIVFQNDAGQIIF